MLIDNFFGDIIGMVDENSYRIDESALWTCLPEMINSVLTLMPLTVPLFIGDWRQHRFQRHPYDVSARLTRAHDVAIDASGIRE